MAYDGSGTFSRLFNWEADRDGGIKIRADRMDQEMDGMATGLSTAVTKDGQTNPTANMPMAGFRHTGVGVASARNHYGVVSQIQDGSYVYGAAAGTANALTLNIAPSITAYATGQTFIFKASAANTAAATLNVDAVGAKAIRKYDDKPLTGGEIRDNGIYVVTYDADANAAAGAWLLLNPTRSAEPGHIFGLTLTNGTDTEHDIDIAVGDAASDDSDPALMRLDSAFTKQFDATFAEGSAAGGMVTGESLPTSGTVHVWLIMKADGTVDVCANNAATTGLTPTLPTDFIYKRRIGSLRTDASANIRQFRQIGDRFIYTGAQPLDVNVSNQGVNRITYSISVPIDITPIALLRTRMSNASSAQHWIQDPAMNDAAPSATASPLADHSQGAGTSSFQTMLVRTNSSGEVAARSNASSSTLLIVTLGWIDTRGRDA